MAQFIDLYDVVAKHLKKCFPNIKIGGPAFTTPFLNEDREAFMVAVKERNLPLDFYSFHRYTKKPEGIAAAVRMAKETVDRLGLGDPELILNEWNYIRGWMEEDWKYSLRMETSLKGSSFVAGSMFMGQASELSMLMYYDARPCGMCGLFDTDSLARRKGYYVFDQFKALRRLGTDVGVCAQTENIYACAATDGVNGAVMLTHFDDVDEAPAEDVCLAIKGLGTERAVRAQLYLLDETHDNELVREEILTAKQCSLYLSMKLFDTCLIRFTEIDR
jgi:hypothetical protein